MCMFTLVEKRHTPAGALGVNLVQQDDGRSWFEVQRAGGEGEIEHLPCLPSDFQARTSAGGPALQHVFGAAVKVLTATQALNRVTFLQATWPSCFVTDAECPSPAYSPSLGSPVVLNQQVRCFPVL